MLLNKKIFNAFIILSCAGIFSGCYYLQGIKNQGWILLARRPINHIILENKLPADNISKLKLVLDARQFADSIGLKAGGSYQEFVDLEDKNELVHVLVCAEKLSFKLHTWSFPILGELPYKGFFDREDAEKELERLTHGTDYECTLRGSDAFSTLGWFDDPILSTTLRRSTVAVITTLFHELLHRNIWRQDSEREVEQKERYDTAWNESLANFVGIKAAQQFFSYDPSLRQLADGQVNKSFAIAAKIGELYTKLTQLYEDADMQHDTKLKLKTALFQEYRELLPAEHANNAGLIQLWLYYRDINLFSKAWSECSESWPCFWEAVSG